MAADKQTHRVQRVEKEVQHCLASLIISHYQREWDGIVTITRIQMPGDLKTAKVYIHFFGEESQKDFIYKTFQKEARFLQEEVSHKLGLRYCPKFTFYWDEGYESTLKIEKILHTIKTSENTDGGES